MKLQYTSVNEMTIERAELLYVFLELKFGSLSYGSAYKVTLAIHQLHHKSVIKRSPKLPTIANAITYGRQFCMQ